MNNNGLVKHMLTGEAEGEVKLIVGGEEYTLTLQELANLSGECWQPFVQEDVSHLGLANLTADILSKISGAGDLTEDLENPNYPFIIFDVIDNHISITTSKVAEPKEMAHVGRLLRGQLTANVRRRLFKYFVEVGIPAIDHVDAVLFGNFRVCAFLQDQTVGLGELKTDKVLEKPTTAKKPAVKKTTQARKPAAKRK